MPTINRITLERIIQRAASFDGWIDVEGIDPTDLQTLASLPDYHLNGHRLWLKPAWECSAERLFLLQSQQRAGTAVSAELRGFYEALGHIGLKPEAIQAMLKLPNGKALVTRIMEEHKDLIGDNRLLHSTQWRSRRD